MATTTPGGAVRPVTRHERREQLDRAAARAYRRRIDIDQRLRDMALARELKETWQ